MIKIGNVYLGLQAITVTNNAEFGNLFKFPQERVLAAGNVMNRAQASALELPAQDFLSYENTAATASQLHNMGINVLGTYLGSPGEGQQVSDWIEKTEADIKRLKGELFPELRTGCLHPWKNDDSNLNLIEEMVNAVKENNVDYF